MILSNFHTHTIYSDGTNSVQEYIDAATALGFRTLGFSEHGYVPFEGLYNGMAPGVDAEYRAVIGGLKERYAGRISLYAGLENDSVNLQPAGDYDFTIGSVHCIKCGDKYYSVDSRESIASFTVTEEFGGDGLAYAKAYFSAVLEFAKVKRADILGHIDLIRRFNTDARGGRRFFDEADKVYRRAAVEALEQAVRSGYFIEINTAPISKGFSDEPYPSRFLIEQASEMGARVIVGSDAHCTTNLNYAFDRVEAILRETGFKERWELTADGFEPVRL